MDKKDYYEMQGIRIPTEPDHKDICIAHPLLVTQVQNLSQDIKDLKTTTNEELKTLKKTIENLEGYRLVEKGKTIKAHEQDHTYDTLRNWGVLLIAIIAVLISAYSTILR